MIYQISALVMCFVGLAYVLYSAHFLPLVVVISTAINNVIYLILILHLTLIGHGDSVPPSFHAWLYLYAVVNFAAGIVCLFYLKKRRNKWPCIFGEKGNNFPDLEKALAAFDIEIKRVSEND